jgi:hypothetical protein
LLLPAIEDFGIQKPEAIPSLILVGTHFAIMQLDAIGREFACKLVRS